MHRVSSEAATPFIIKGMIAAQLNFSALNLQRKLLYYLESFGFKYMGKKKFTP